MATGTITKRAVDALQGGVATSFLWDSGDGSIKGFGVRVTPAGGKSYVYQYRMGGRVSPVRRYTIGRHGDFTPSGARERARELAESVRRGIDPIEAEAQSEIDRASRKAAQVAAEREAKELAFNAYVQRYLALYVKPKRPDSYVFVEGTLRNHASPVLADKPLPQITKRDIVRLLDRIPLDRPAVRRNVFAVLRKLFNWAKGRDDIAASPMESIEAPETVPARDRVLSDTELALAIRAADALHYPFGPLFTLLFATGQRREEGAGLRWEELDRANALWTLPRERSKNNEASIIPLNSLAMAALDKAATRGKEGALTWPARGFVFTTTGERPVSGHSKAKAQLDAMMLQITRQDAQDASQELPEAIGGWRLHDARRTLATGLQRLGVRFEVTEAVLNHVSGSRSGVAGIYQRHGWGPEKRAALDAWAAHIEGLLNPASDTSNVVSIRADGKAG